jgi:tyrosine-protein phosphatase ERK
MVRQNIDKNDGKGVQKIAMLTDFIESSRHKCAAYFPSEVGDVSVFTNSPLSEDEHLVRSKVDQILHFDENDEIEIGISSFNYFVVKNISMKQKNGYSIRKLRIYYGNHRFQKPKEFEVYHYWFPDWPDHRSPEDIDVLLDLSLDLLDGNCERDFDESCEEFSDRHPLPIIHCSAGIGRTGCLAAILNGLGQIRSNTEEISVDILGIVCNLRLQRGGMVQNSEQYELIHRSICLFHHKMTTKLK